MSEDAQKLQQLLTEGPELGIHTILWLDNLKGIISLTADSLKPWLAHFDLRTVLSISAEDSGKLIGETWAQKLPPIRAYFKDYGVVDSPEKFKPYAVPSLDVIQEYQTRFQSRG